MITIATFSLTDAGIWVGGYDFSADSNQVELSVEADEKETTTFGGGGYKSRIGGHKDVSAEVSGLWQSAATDAVDPHAFANLGVAERVVTMSPTASVAGSVAYMYRAVQTSYKLLGSVGEVAPFSLSLLGSNGQGLVRGQIAKTRGTIVAAGVLGSVVNLGAVGATQYLYATVHVFSAGTSATITVESDSASNFPSATTVHTFSAFTATGGTWMARIPGPLTDSFFRLNCTLLDGAFNLAGAIGIGS